MLEVINAGSTELSCSRGDSTIMLNCWEKSSPLIKELERTVNFAERKCGDLMQQLHFYKEYYEKWGHTERVSNLCQKKKTKKCCRQALNTGSSSESEFEKVNHYLYKKIKRKINEMNNEVTKANRKLCNKNETEVVSSKDDRPTDSAPADVVNNTETKIVENKACKSEPLVTLSNQEPPQPPPDIPPDDREEIKVSEKQSSKSMPPTRHKNSKRDFSKKRDFVTIKRRYASLQRYKLRSKSLPQGVRRKFGFGSFVEVLDPKTKHDSFSAFSKSKTSMKTISSKSLKSQKSEGKSKTRLAEQNRLFSYKMRGNVPKSSRSFHYRLRNSKTDAWTGTQRDRNYFSKDVKSDSAVTRNKIHIIHERNAIFHNTICQKSENASFRKSILPSENVEKKTSVVDTKGDCDSLNNLNTLIAKPNTLIPFLRNPIPFIPCSSTSKTFNLGLNVQQVLSLIKHKRHSITLQAIVKNGVQAARAVTDKAGPTVNTLFISQTTTSHGHLTSAICPARECSEDGFSVFTDNLYCQSKCSMLKQLQATRPRAIEERKTEDNTKGDAEQNPEEHVEMKKLDRPEDVWVVDQPDSALKSFKKFQTRCTCFPSKHCVDYHKVLRQYTGWKLPEPKPESFTSDAYSSFDPMIACHKSKLYPVQSQENVEISLRENDGKIELMKVHDDLINLNRKYSTLQEQISQNSLDDFEANVELDAMESELAVREVEFKEILNFYNQLMILKERLKSLRMRNGHSMSHSTIQQPQYQRLRKDPLRPTPSMALTKVLRKIQGLQDKIKLIDAP